MSYFDKLKEQLKSDGMKTVAVACADDSVVLEAMDNARKMGVAKSILVGNKESIENQMGKLGIPLSEFQVIDSRDETESARIAVELVSSGKAHILMKGNVKTSTFLKAILDKEIGLRTGSLLSHVMVFEHSDYDRLFLVTDGGMNLHPDFNELTSIAKNAVEISRKLGVEIPKVACVCAVETVKAEMEATVNAAMLTLANKRGQIKGCLIDGPLALDNAVSIEAAEHKGIVSPVAGLADILLVPDIEAGNILGKSIIYFAKCRSGGLIAGAKAPVIMLSRADTQDTKINSILLGCKLCN